MKQLIFAAATTGVLAALAVSEVLAHLLAMGSLAVRP
jgi:hypothetical protein